MPAAVYSFDEANDILYVSFSVGEKGTGIELNDQILLRVNKAQRRAVGLTLFEYSVLAQPTEVGPRSFPLTGLSELSNELRELVLEIVVQPPVSSILHLSAFTPSASEIMPIASISAMPASLSPQPEPA